MQNALSQVLIDKFGLSEMDMKAAADLVSEKGEDFGKHLVKKNIISEDQYLEALGFIYGIPFKQNLSPENMDFDFTQFIPIQF